MDAKAFFTKDRYATDQTGIEILEGSRYTARCRLRLDDRHRAAYGGIMGGVYFTLADFTFAIASNTDLPRTVTVSADIHYFAVPRGGVLYSQAKLLHDGRTTCAYEVAITDAEDRLVAKASFSGMKLSD